MWFLLNWIAFLYISMLLVLPQFLSLLIFLFLYFVFRLNRLVLFLLIVFLFFYSKYLTSLSFYATKIKFEFKFEFKYITWTRIWIRISQRLTKFSLSNKLLLEKTIRISACAYIFHSLIYIPVFLHNVRFRL